MAIYATKQTVSGQDIPTIDNPTEGKTGYNSKGQKVVYNGTKWVMPQNYTPSQTASEPTLDAVRTLRDYSGQTSSAPVIRNTVTNDITGEKTTLTYGDGTPLEQNQQAREQIQADEWAARYGQLGGSSQYDPATGQYTINDANGQVYNTNSGSQFYADARAAAGLPPSVDNPWYGTTANPGPLTVTPEYPTGGPQPGYTPPPPITGGENNSPPGTGTNGRPDAGAPPPITGMPPPGGGKGGMQQPQMPPGGMGSTPGMPSSGGKGGQQQGPMGYPGAGPSNYNLRGGYQGYQQSPYGNMMGSGMSGYGMYGGYQKQSPYGNMRYNQGIPGYGGGPQYAQPYFGGRSQPPSGGKGGQQQGGMGGYDKGSQSFIPPGETIGQGPPQMKTMEGFVGHNVDRDMMRTGAYFPSQAEMQNRMGSIGQGPPQNMIDNYNNAQNGPPGTVGIPYGKPYQNADGSWTQPQ